MLSGSSAQFLHINFRSRSVQWRRGITADCGAGVGRLVFLPGTYNRAVYAEIYRWTEAHFNFRLYAAEHGLQAGFRLLNRVSLWVISPWGGKSIAPAAHLESLRQHDAAQDYFDFCHGYGRGRGFLPLFCDKRARELAQLFVHCSYFPPGGIVLSTRERAHSAIHCFVRRGR